MIHRSKTGKRPRTLTGTINGRSTGPQQTAADSALVAGLSAAAIPCHYAPREWTFTSEPARARHHLLAVSRGVAMIDLGEDCQRVVAPAVVWVPPCSIMRIEILPGGAGSLLGASVSTLQRTIGRGADLALESLLRVTCPAAIPVKPRTAEAVAASIALIADELTNAEAGSPAIVSYELTLCVMRVWRETGDMRGPAFRSNTELLQRFRHLVEERYREHLPLTAYAAALGVSLDRLHAVCTRVLGRSPRTLLQERLLAEAIARLEHSGTSVKQVAFTLGFKDTSHFSRFFHQHVGQPPGAWRQRRAVQELQSHASRMEPTFADWP